MTTSTACLNPGVPQPANDKPEPKTSEECRQAVARIDDALEALSQTRKADRKVVAKVEAAAAMGEPPPDDRPVEAIYAAIATAEQREKALMVARASAIGAWKAAQAREKAAGLAERAAALQKAQAATDAACAAVYPQLRQLWRLLAGVKTARDAERQAHIDLGEIEREAGVKAEGARRVSFVIPNGVSKYDRNGRVKPEWDLTPVQEALGVKEELDDLLYRLACAQYMDEMPAFLWKFFLFEDYVKRANGERPALVLSTAENDRMNEALVASED